MCSLHSTTKGRDIFEAVMKAVNSVGGFEKCSVLATDGAKTMVGTKIGLIGCLRENGMKCPALHSIFIIHSFYCNIHQHALCGKSVKQTETLKKVLKVIDMIRGGNRALMHRRQFRNFLEEIEAEYGDLLTYNQVRWFSARNSSLFLHHFFPSENLEEKLLSMDFSRHLAFLTDITGHLNHVNLKLQERGQLVSDLMAHSNGFSWLVGFYWHKSQKWLYCARH
ncbi:protein FAM200C-like [Parasteatoda tepidariorum]|uniref:protein FAM200C-like n=1 Tax=Parasteatoda tepidariorum TaxID=114398 RepID=UPI0039BCD2F6